MPNHTVTGLSDTHYDELFTGSNISDQRIRQRYYQSVTADQLPREFAGYQHRPGLLIPIRSVRGRIESWQLKPDNPRIGKNGNPIKYETTSNATQAIDCSPSEEKAETWLVEFLNCERVLASAVEAAAKDLGFSKTSLH